MPIKASILLANREHVKMEEASNAATCYSSSSDSKRRLCNKDQDLISHGQISKCNRRFWKSTIWRLAEMDNSNLLISMIIVIAVQWIQRNCMKHIVLFVLCLPGISSVHLPRIILLVGPAVVYTIIATCVGGYQQFTSALCTGMQHIG